MGFWLIRFTLALTLAQEMRSLPLGCPFNGTTYGEGETVMTEEPCLSCVCQGGALACSLRVCADPPDPPSPGCFVVHKPNDCCPQLVCEESFTENGVELRTALKAEREIKGNDCKINGSTYAEGSALASSQLCEYCYCVRGEMKCIKPRCFQPFQPFEGCKPIFQNSACCPTHYDCRGADVNFLTAQMKTLVKGESKTWSNSVRSLENSEEGAQKEIEQVQVTEMTDRTTEFLGTTTTESITEVSTVQPETEPTVDEGLTDFGNSTSYSFQTTKFENFSREATEALTEEVTWEPEGTSPVPLPATSGPEGPLAVGKEDFGDNGGAKGGGGLLSEEPHGNSSQEAEDYDAYDYSEPKLPPSLPNLVIFPFVAADAVVKDDSVSAAEDHEKTSIERVDAHPVFYKDYFSPPLKTEGGFIPKEPLPPDKSFYEYSYLKNEQNIVQPAGIDDDLKNLPDITVPPKLRNDKCFSDGREVMHGEVLSEMGDCVVCTCLHGEVVCQDVPCPILNPGCRRIPEKDFSCCGKIICEPNSSVLLESQRIESTGATPDPFGDVIRTESAPDLTIRDGMTPIRKHQATKKPVTVAYKNVIVDYYPDYLITSTRGEFKVKHGEKTASGNSPVIFHATTTTTEGENRSSVTSRPNTDEANTSAPLLTTVTEDILTRNITDSEFVTSTTESSFFYEILKTFLEDTKVTTTTSSSTKHKYSSKIKVTTTSKPKMEDVTEISGFQTTPEIPIKSEGAATAFPAEKEENLQSTEIPLQLTTTRVENGQIEEEKPQVLHGKDRPNVGTLLKLAGCNIYGRMYRVGKIIMELSGPCLECLCTDLGVQCTALGC